MMQISEELREHIPIFQKTEITEYYIYKRLAKRISSPKNAKILSQIAEDKLHHYNGWKRYSGPEIQSRWFFVWVYYLGSLAFGFTFGVKLISRPTY